MERSCVQMTLAGDKMERRVCSLKNCLFSWLKFLDFNNVAFLLLFGN